MIPKIIHYCWFGGNKKSSLMEKCINSWKKILPDYEIIEWDEHNFDISSYKFTSYAYNNEQWALVSDYVRLKVIHEMGGIYLDTDVEILKSLDGFLNQELFMGFQSNTELSTAVFGAVKANKHMGSLLEIYDSTNLQVKSEKDRIFPNNKIFTTYFSDKVGLQLNNEKQKFDKMSFIYPKEYFTLKTNDVTNFAVHYFNNSWLSHEQLNRQMNIYKTNYFLSLSMLNMLIDRGEIFHSIRHSSQSMAIYGLGLLGELMVKQCIKEGIPIKLIIDKNYSLNSFQGIPVVNHFDEKEIDFEIDTIIVTSVFHYEEIKNSINVTKSIKVMCADEIFSL